MWQIADSDFINEYYGGVLPEPEHYEYDQKCFKNLENAAKRRFNKTQEILAKDPEKYTDETGCIDFAALYFDTFPKYKKEFEDRQQWWAETADETDNTDDEIEDIILIAANKRAAERAKNKQIVNTETEIIETETEITENCEQNIKEDPEMLTELQQKLADLEKIISDQNKIIENQNNIIEDLKSEIDQLKNIDHATEPEIKPAEIEIVAEYIENNKLIESAEYLGSADRYTGPKEYFKLQTNCEYSGPDLVLEIDKDFLTPVLIAADDIENILDILRNNQSTDLLNWGPVHKTANFG